MAALDGFQWGQNIQGSGNWQDDPRLQQLMGLAGTKAGTWQQDPASGRWFIETPYGKATDQGNFDHYQFQAGGNDGMGAYQFNGGAVGAKHSNENGSDMFRMDIDKDGNYQNARMDNQSERTRNLALAGIAGLGAGAFLSGGAAAAGGGGASGGLGGAAAVESSVVPIGASEYAAMGGAGLAGAGGAGGGAGLLGSAGSFAANNPGLLAAGLGAVAGGLSGNRDQTQTGTQSSTQSSSQSGTINQQRGLVDYALPAGQAYAGMAQNTIDGKYLGQGLGTNPYAGQNKFLNGAMDNVARRMTDAYKDGTASQTMGQFAANGAFGGSAMQQYQQSQNRAFGDSLGQTLGGMQMQDYTQQQGLAENSLNRQLSQFQGERNNMMGAASGLGNLGGTNNQQSTGQTQGQTTGTSSQTTPGVGFLQGAIGGGLAGYGMYQQAQQPNYLGGAYPYQQQRIA